MDHLPWPGVDHVVNLGFEPLPFDDNSFTTVFAWDFFEHLPKGVHYRDDSGKWVVHHPHLLVFNEVWRVLVPGGKFDTFTPIKEPAVNGRLFHFSTWSLNQFEQFTKDGSDFRRGHMQMNGFKGEFEIEQSWEENFGLHVIMKSVKPCTST